MKAIIAIVLCMLAVSTLGAAGVDAAQAQQAAISHLAGLHSVAEPQLSRVLAQQGRALAYVFSLSPQGYVVVCADDDLPPVIAYSLTASFSAQDSDLLAELLTADLAGRMMYLEPAQREENRLAWQNIGSQRDPFQQWPPEGSTITEGWVKTEWTQNAPYNDMCPMDPVTNQRSIAGCPSVAMAQIVNYYQTINGTTFSDADDYYHSYAGRNYSIDDDAVARDFPTWGELNQYLVDLVFRYRHHQETTNEGKAALTYACGVAAEQVYTSSGSGTFGVAQAFAAFQKFGFQEMELLTDAAPDLYDRMAQNMMDASPVHLAIVTPAWDAGHNVVVDGYNTDNYYHLNFGWGGTYSGWYLLPSEIPYNLTVIEGAIVDIHPKQYLFAVPDTLQFLTVDSVYNPQTLEIININDEPITIEEINPFPLDLGQSTLQWNHWDYNIPYILAAGQSLYLTLEWIWVLEQPRNIIQGSIEVVHQFGVYNIPMVIQDSLFVSSLDDDVQPPPNNISAYPNPFTSELTIRVYAADEFTVRIYNLKGQCVRALGGSSELVWDGRDEQGKIVANGIYLIKSEQQAYPRWKKVIKL